MKAILRIDMDGPLFVESVEQAQTNLARTLRIEANRVDRGEIEDHEIQFRGREVGEFCVYTDEGTAPDGGRVRRLGSPAPATSAPARKIMDLVVCARAVTDAFDMGGPEDMDEAVEALRTTLDGLPS